MLENQDQNSNASSDQALAESKAAKARFENRRRLLKAMAVAAPLIITLRGKPAHAQLSSLGSAGILYGPGAYVRDTDVGTGGIEGGDIGKPLKLDTNDGKYKVLTDETRRDQKSIENGKEVTRP